MLYPCLYNLCYFLVFLDILVFSLIYVNKTPSLGSSGFNRYTVIHHSRNATLTVISSSSFPRGLCCLCLSHPFLTALLFSAAILPCLDCQGNGFRQRMDSCIWLLSFKEMSWNFTRASPVYSLYCWVVFHFTDEVCSLSLLLKSIWAVSSGLGKRLYKYTLLLLFAHIVCEHKFSIQLANYKE